MNMQDCNQCSTPMEARLHLIKGSSEALVDATEYRSVVGALRYLVHTRPDLAHSVSYVSRFMAESHKDHQAAVKRILRYIAGTRDHGVDYAKGKAGELLLLGYSDRDPTRWGAACSDPKHVAHGVVATKAQFVFCYKQ